MFRTLIPPEKSKWTPTSKRLLCTFHKPPSEIFSVFSSLQACRYLSYLVYPLCISGAIFSLFYLRQKRWESRLTHWQIWTPFRLYIDHICPGRNWSMQSILFSFAVITRGWSTLWWLVSSCASTLSAETNCVFPDWPLLWLLTSSQEFMPLASFQWRLSFLSITRSVLRCHGNISDTVTQQIHDRLTPLCVPPICLDQLKSVSHLQKAVFMYRVSVNTFFRGFINGRVLPELGLFQILVSIGWISSSALPFFSNCPTGGEHSDHRSVLRCLLFLPFPFCLLISSTLLLQRWTLPLHLPLPAMVGQHTSITLNSDGVNSHTLLCCCFISSSGVTPPRPDDESLGHKARKSKLTEKKGKKNSDIWT